MITGFGNLVEAVQRNCDIADARHARDVSLCTYLLEMREFFRWEQDLPLGVPPPRAEVGEWISAREARWENMAGEDFLTLPVAGRNFDPFDAESVNKTLLPAGLVYGAGVGRFHKPHFFLGRLERVERHDDLDVLVCACEYARDLTAFPAAQRGGTVVVRREALRQWLWEKVEAWQMKRTPGAMARALEAHGYDADPGAALERLADEATEALILHECGEAAVGRLLGSDWEAMLSACTSRQAEILARAVRDNLADCLTTLPALVGREDVAVLHFWFANFDGMRREIFPALAEAYEIWNRQGDRKHLRETVAAGSEHWQRAAERLLSDFRRGQTCDAATVAFARPTA